MNDQQINDIINRYPYPIAILYRTVAGLDLREEPVKGLEYILQTAESTARLLGVIALLELVALKEKADVEIPNSVKAEFKKNIKRPSFGIWLSFAREGFGFLKRSGSEIVIPELKDLFYENKKETDFKIALDKLIKLRNAVAHRKVVLDTLDKQRSAVNIAVNFLHAILTRLAFFKDVNFGYIKSIELSKKPRRQPEFLHKGKNLKGDSIGKGINLSNVLNNYKETDAVIIRFDADSYLNLYPFYIYDESSGDAADVFYYNGLDKKRLEYIGIDPGGKLFAENKAQEQSLDIEEEFDLLMAGCGRKIDKENIKFSPELHQELAYVAELLS